MQIDRHSVFIVRCIYKRYTIYGKAIQTPIYSPPLEIANILKAHYIPAPPLQLRCPPSPDFPYRLTPYMCILK